MERGTYACSGCVYAGGAIGFGSSWLIHGADVLGLCMGCVAAAVVMAVLHSLGRSSDG